MEPVPASQTDIYDLSHAEYFSGLGWCVFLLLVVIGSGGITAWLILTLVPWALDYPVPILAYVPLAAVGAAGPIILFVMICKASRTARRLLFKWDVKPPARAESGNTN